MLKIIVRYSVWLTISAILLLIMALNTSPLSDFLGSDSVMYRLMGQCWYNGDMVYVDLFDNKGPYLYLIQMLGIAIHPERWGIFILQVVNFAIIFDLFYRIAGLFSSKRWQQILSVIASTLLCISIFEGGNLTEDWSLSFLLLPLYLSLKWLKTNPSTPHPYIYSAIYGLCFGIVSLIRLNNTAIIVGIVIGLLIMHIINRQYRKLGLNAVSFIIGMAIAITPMLLYFGLNHSLDDMIYATLLYNIKYSQVWPTLVDSPIWNNVIRLLPCLLACIIAVIYDYCHKSRLALIIIPAAIITSCAFVNGSGFFHYFVITVPIFLLAFAMSLQLPRIAMVISILCLLINPLYADRIQTNAELVTKTNTLFSNKKSNAHPYSQIIAKIPSTERDSIFAYNLKLIQNDIFIQMNTIPTMRYSYMHDYVSKVDTLVDNEIKRYMRTQRPLWIATLPKQQDSAFAEMLSDYKLRHKTKVINLYRRKTANDSISK